MRQKSGPEGPAEKTVKDNRRATRKRHATVEKNRIVLEGLRGEYSIAELRRREGMRGASIAMSSRQKVFDDRPFLR